MLFSLEDDTVNTISLFISFYGDFWLDLINSFIPFLLFLFFIYLF